MREIVCINDGWKFYKGVSKIGATEGGESVSLPHTWNATDGQDGGNDYFRGTCLYSKKIKRSELPENEVYYLEICGANSSADVFVNGKKLAHHDGGYSTWRVDITSSLSDENLIEILVDNAPNDSVYPQMADFTFYGGLYRDVNIIAVGKTHFELDFFGASGIAVTPDVSEAVARTTIKVFVSNMQKGDEIVYKVVDREGREIYAATTEQKRVEAIIERPHLWHGRRDPYLYTAVATIVRDGVELDSVSTRFGCRSFQIDSERGFILNGEEYPLRGVSRHQDRLGIGNALLPEHHREDMELIMEVGATTVRLAHYQHAQYFLDLCDENGLVIWAEIPYISKHLPNGNENTVSQLKELIYQNYNHPSIVVWGLSNEITMNGANDPDLIANHKRLNSIAHEIDKTRLTAVACVSMCSMDEEYVHISDVVSYNHYFGWYGGDTSMNGPWFDEFHRKYPSKPIGVSEYGCEALNWHTSNPTQGDYTEEYQAYYHEELIKQLYTRRYLWATHVWNMFDFGADARAEGGENGQNHKGLVTMDRKYKKHAFYAYKAWLSDEPFVHICGKRYIDRVEEKTRVTVYSNLPEVELFVNGKSVGKQSSDVHFFYFNIENSGESKIVARAGSYSDESVIRRVDKPNEAYILRERGAVLNWFDVDMPQGFFSLNDKLGDIMRVPRGRAWFESLADKMKAAMSEAGDSTTMQIELNEDVMKMMSGFTVLRFVSMLGMMNLSFTKEELLTMNAQLKKIEKPKGE